VKKDYLVPWHCLSLRRLRRREGIMSAKIIIERRFNEAPTPENFRLINDLRRKAMRQKGYVSGETLVDFDQNHVVVLSTWASLDDWKRWVNSEERNALEKNLATYLKESARVRSFMASADYLSEAVARS
jgi:heme-degrading monooxygenase HmoA